jgi:hypothetical protein
VLHRSSQRIEHERRRQQQQRRQPGRLEHERQQLGVRERDEFVQR